MKKVMVILVACSMIFSLTACGNGLASSSTGNEVAESIPDTDAPSQAEETRNETEESVPGTDPSSQTEETELPENTDTSSDTETGQAKGQTNALVAYFAYSENMGDTSGMSVDAITSASVGQTSNTEGNLQVIAQVIQENTGADVFHIVAASPYDPEYDVMHDRAIDEQSNNARPALEAKIENLDQYDVIYLGTPVWGGSLPAPVLTFLDENDLSGKTIIPFGIHLGSGFGRNLSQIEDKYPSATLLDGLTVNARTDNDDVRAQAGEWLESLEIE